VKNGKIVRIEPLSFEDAKTWKISAGGRTFSPARKNLVRNWALTYRRYIYSSERIGYPMKRVTYIPSHGGENSGDRAKNEFVRISWEEALTIVTNELKRMKEAYGNSAICAWTPSHNEYGVVHYTGILPRFFRCFGGYTVRQSMDHSWVGWQTGGIFTWGYDQGCDAADSGSDTMQNSKMVVYWSRDPLNVLLYEGYDRALPWYSWIKSLGIKQIVISPNFHETAVGWADKWLPVYPVTDNALAAAIAYTWIKEGTLDQNFLDTHTVGFDEEHLPQGAPPNSSFKSYITGVSDGVPKTPEWAEKICGVPARTIEALAREWAAHPTTTVNTGGTGGAACRTAYGHEWCRMMITLQAMQGLGRPGVQMISDFAPPRDARNIAPA
jgi:anaerobic selenocysteine-containing dehydrogenase